MGFSENVWDPNIVGDLGQNTGSSVSGAFYEQQTESKPGATHSTGGTPMTNRVWIDASKSSSIYTTNGTLQTSALQVLACVKI